MLCRASEDVRRVYWDSPSTNKNLNVLLHEKQTLKPTLQRQDLNQGHPQAKDQLTVTSHYMLIVAENALSFLLSPSILILPFLTTPASVSVYFSR